MVKVGVIGSAGKMGRLACEAIDDADGLQLVAGLGRGDSLSELGQVEVAVDFTNPGVVMDHITWCIENDIHVVAGTSGFTDQRLTAIERQLGDRPSVGVLVVPNFSLGAVLMMRFAAQAARFFESVEIVEMHHPGKLDAPSGTSIRTAQQVAAARNRAGLGPMPDATVGDASRARGGVVAGIPVHSLRAQGLVAHQEVLLGGVGETLTIRHDMLDRAATMPAIVACVRAAVGMRGLQVGLESVYHLDD
jgi:4-hydroxy-tetrahydrodipicolinate reductase